MKKGFTLIELLAVIVILAIIALIAVPIVLNIINDSKKNASERSAENYMHAVELAIANRGMYESFDPEECQIQSDGNLMCDGVMLEVDVDGERPTSGIIKFKEGKIDGYDVKINDISVSKPSEDVICVRTDSNTVTTGNIPQGNYANGDEYICEVKKGVKYHFFVISKEGNQVNLIMDRNIQTNGTPATEDNLSQVAWCSREDYDAKNATESANPDGVDEYASSVNFCPKSNNVMAEEGAITATNAVKLYTSSWDNLSNTTYQFSVSPYMVNPSNKEDLFVPNPAEQSNELQTAIWTPYGLDLTSKARLMTVAEAFANGCKAEVNEDRNGDGVIEKINVNSCPLYLSNYLSHGEKFVSGDKVVDIANLKGYWLLNGGACMGFVIHNNGSINSKETTNSAHSGVRPVITLNKTDLG